ncbi:restriction endonuclease subunit S [Streptomyces cahuitamycinicus]|uniref:Type I restriction modification DNA specificity domain-containing protein n=1 Tax=Streptomyces cahuitamycinicus TaxID=2070367 RepID=A0A2N8TJI5_9ACTN|nr:restriction endonuclease subunit S [Streptomyces cahuitamycinicus]PNG19187.1 hypothetical protein C1J00_27090 [Streptomyces cahuitamycinicus]
MGKTLGDICELIVDSEHKTAPSANPGTTYGYSIGTPHIRNGRILFDTAIPVDEKTYSEWTERETPQEGDLILTREAPVGQVGRIDAGQRVCLRQRTVLLRPASEHVNSRYLLYALMAPPIQDRMHARAAGSTVPHLNIKDVRSLDIGRIPAMTEQRAIAEVLGVLDDKIAVNERIAETAMELAQARYALTPATAQTRIGDIATVFDGPHATPQKTPHGPWFLSISSLKGGVLDLAESAHLSDIDFPRWTKRVQPQEGDVLFSYETRLGEAALMPAGIRACLGRRMGLLRPRSTSVNGALLLHAYLSCEFQEEIRRRTVHGATVDRIPLKEMPSWPISLPADNDRQDLVAALNALHTEITHTADENRVLTELRDTLLPQLVTGKLRIKDAEQAVEDAV